MPAASLYAQTTGDANGAVCPESRTSVPTGCRALLLAMLQDLFAVRDTLNRISLGDARYHVLTGVSASDREWLASESDAPFSFLWICHHLGLDPDFLRRCYHHGHAVQSNVLAGWKNAGRGATPITVDRVPTRHTSAYAPRAVR